MVRPGRLVLIVDRDLDFVEDLRVLLRDHRALAARSMSEAVEILVGGRVDVVVLGPSFGSEAGVRGAADIFDADPDVAVVLVANIVTNRVLRAALQIGLVDVVDAPVTLRKLSEAFERAGEREGAVARTSEPVPASQPSRSEAAPSPEVLQYDLPDRTVPTSPAPVAAASAAAATARPSGPQLTASRGGFEGVELIFGGAATDSRVLEFDQPRPVAKPVPPVVSQQGPPVELHFEAPVPHEPPTRPSKELPTEATAPSPMIESTPAAGKPAPTPRRDATPATQRRATSAPSQPSAKPAAPPSMPPPAMPSMPAHATASPAPPTMAPPVPAAPPVSSAAPAEAPPVHRPLPAGGPSGPTVTVERPKARSLSGNGRVITITSGKAGSGKTVTATNVAAAMTERLGPDRVVIIDADMQFGDVALLLQLEPTRTVIEAIDSVDGLSDARLDAMLLRHDSGLRVLPAPLLPLPPESVSIGGLIAVIERLKRMYEVVIVDTSPIFGPTLLSLLDHSDTVLMVVDMDLPSVKNAKIAIESLRNDGYPSERIHLVVNRVNSKARLDLVELERSLGLRVSGSIPSDRIVPQSVNEGIPVVLLSPRSRVAKSFHSIAERFGPDRARRAS